LAFTGVTQTHAWVTSTRSGVFDMQNYNISQIEFKVVETVDRRHKPGGGQE